METAVVCSGSRCPLVEESVAGHAEAAPLVRGGDEAEEQLRAHGIERRKPELVDDDQITAEQAVDQLADGVVGEAAVQRLHKVSGGEIADPAPRGHRCVARTDQQM